MPKYFQYSEFDQKGMPGSGEVHMDKTFVALLDQLRENVGFALIITSGYRSPEYNASVSHTGTTGPHTTGKAVDIAIRGYQAHKLLKEALELGFSGIGISQKGESRFVHLDTLSNGEQGAPRPTIWSY